MASPIGHRWRLPLPSFDDILQRPTPTTTIVRPTLATTSYHNFSEDHLRWSTSMTTTSDDQHQHSSQVINSSKDHLQWSTSMNTLGDNSNHQLHRTNLVIKKRKSTNVSSFKYKFEIISLYRLIVIFKERSSLVDNFWDTSPFPNIICPKVRSFNSLMPRVENSPSREKHKSKLQVYTRRILNQKKQDQTIDL